VLEHPSLFASEKRHTFADAGELFATIGNTLQRELIAGNARTAH
jgi:hypothetical protein